MPTTAPPPPAHQAPTAEPASVRRTSWWDPLTLIVLGLSGGALSYDALRQMAVAVHIRPHLAYLFPLVIDGFIAYGVRALLVLRDAPWPARAYAWTLFGTATAASLWANALHAVRLNQPGVHTLTLGDHTVAVLSAIAPLALAGATHMHILIGRHNSSHRIPTAGTPTMIPADPTMIPAEEHTTLSQDQPASQPAARLGTAAGTQDGTPPELAGITGQDDERPVQKLNTLPANAHRPGAADARQRRRSSSSPASSAGRTRIPARPPAPWPARPSKPKESPPETNASPKPSNPSSPASKPDPTPATTEPATRGGHTRPPLPAARLRLRNAR